MCVSSSNTHNVSRGLSGKYGHLFKKFNTSQYKYSLPDDIDWRTSGAVTSVKDQVSCWLYNTQQCTRVYLASVVYIQQRKGNKQSLSCVSSQVT